MTPAEVHSSIRRQRVLLVAGFIMMIAGIAWYLAL